MAVNKQCLMSPAGVSDLGFRYELCENPSMRKKLKMAKAQNGVHVIRVRY